MDINRGDRFEHDRLDELAFGVAARPTARSTCAADDPRQKEIYKEGDFNVSLIRTAKGRVIELEHNVSSPQPYDRINLIAGTKGIFRDYPPRIYIEGAGQEDFGSIDPYKAKYEHRFWKETGELARKLGGHGGMDFVMACRLIECIRERHGAGHRRVRCGGVERAGSAERSNRWPTAARRSSSRISPADAGRRKRPGRSVGRSEQYQAGGDLALHLAVT